MKALGKREKAPVKSRPAHGEGPGTATPAPRIEVRYSGANDSHMVGLETHAILRGSTLVEVPPTDPDEASCRVIVDGRQIACVIWYGPQVRSLDWITQTARQLARTATAAGFGGNALGSVAQLHAQHGIDELTASKLRAIRRARLEAKRQINTELSLEASIPTIDSELETEPEGNSTP